MRKEVDWHMRDSYEMGIFCKSRFTSSDMNILSRIMNSITNAFNARKKLPKIMILVIEHDFIDAL